MTWDARKKHIEARRAATVRAASEATTDRSSPTPPVPEAPLRVDPSPPADVVEPDPAAASSAPALVEPVGLTVLFSSSNIHGAAFDAVTGVLEVEFTNGKRYRYGNFTAELLEAWRAADSAGKWFTANVKQQPAKHPPIIATR